MWIGENWKNLLDLFSSEQNFERVIDDDANGCKEFSGKCQQTVQMSRPFAKFTDAE